VETIPVLLDPYANRTILHPFVAVLLIVMVCFALAKDRKLAVLAIILVTNFVTPAQRISLAGVDFSILRIVVYFLLLRIILRNEISSYKPVKLDYFVFTYVLYSFVCFNVLRHSFSAVATSIGATLDVAGGYLAIRVLIRDDEDVESYVRAMMVVSFIIAPLFLLENATGHNPFFPMGWVPLTPEMRDGKMRLQGPYPHPILAGAYWAAMVPYFLAFKKKLGKYDPLMLLAIAAAVLMILLSSSSTSLMALLAVVPASILFYQRSSQRKLNILIVIGILCLALVMKGPVWSLIARIDLSGGSTGYFRYLLVDAFIRNWKEWFFFGVESTVHWGAGKSLSWAGLGDVANNYVAAGVQGGMIGFVAFVGAMAVAFGFVGKLVRKATSEDRRYQYWHYGVAVFAHAVSFIGVSYYGQIELSWWISIAICASLYQANILDTRREGRLAPSLAAAAG
jgi:hypothetical protein